MFTNNPLTKWYNKLKEFAKKKADDTIFTAYNPGGIVIGHGAGPAKAECLIPVYDARHGGRLDWNGDPERFILFGPAPRTLDGSDPENSVAQVIRDVFGRNNGPIESVTVVSGDPNGYTGVLKLTARTAGAEANNIVFTSSQRKDYTLSEPCFGEHVIKMGSFSPGLDNDASASACKIMLNGEELTTGKSGGGAFIDYFAEKDAQGKIKVNDGDKIYFGGNEMTESFFEIDFSKIISEDSNINYASGIIFFPSEFTITQTVFSPFKTGPTQMVSKMIIDDGAAGTPQFSQFSFKSDIISRADGRDGTIITFDLIKHPDPGYGVIVTNIFLSVLTH